MRSLITLTLLAANVAFSSHAQNWSSGVNGGGANSQITTGVAEQADGSRIVVGDYSMSPAVFGSYSLPWSNNGSSATNTNSFIVKYSSANAVVWATRIGSSFDTEISAVAVDGSGNVYVCGVYRAIATSCAFYSTTNLSVPATTLYHSGGTPTPTEGNRAFVAKYNASGTLSWARLGIGAGLIDDECLSEIAVSEDGTKLVVTGRIYANGPITVNSTVSNGVVDDGSYVLWLNPASGASVMGFNYTNDGGYSNTYRNGLCIDGSNNVYVSGKLSATSYVVKGYGGDTEMVTTPLNGTSTLYAKYTASGAVAWARASQATVANTLSTPSSLVCDDNGVYIGGWVKNATSNFQLRFLSGPSTFEWMQVNTTDADNVYVVRLNAANGYAQWLDFGRGTASGIETVSLTKGPCNLLYAGINTQAANPTFTTDNGSVHTATSPAQRNVLVYRLNASDGSFLTPAPWAVMNTDFMGKGYLATYGTGKVLCAATISTTVSLQTGGTPITLTPSGRDMMLASLTDNSAAPNLTLNPTGAYCPYQNIPLTASSTGTPPFTYTWDIYDNVSGTFVNVGTTVLGAFNMMPAIYNPYIFMLLGTYQVIYVRVGVTNCSGLTDYEWRYIGIKGPVEYSQVNGVEVCYNSPLPAADAVFSVVAQYVDTYAWQYSPDGINWYNVSGLTNEVISNGGATLTLSPPAPGQNGYLFRCIMTGCSSVVSNEALLTVEPCPGIVEPGDPRERMAAGQTEATPAVSMYPNPANEQVNLVVTDEDLTGDWAVQVLDVTGRKITGQAMTEGRCTIATDRFIEGHYLCVITRGGKVVGQQKLVIFH